VLRIIRPVPFRAKDQLNHDLDASSPWQSNTAQCLPGHPRIRLSDIQSLTSFLETEIYSNDLEQMAPYFWLMSWRRSSNISPLHRQIVKGRDIVVAEDPSLHLVWRSSRIHMKPIPAHLLNYAFWKQYLLDDESPLPGRRRVRILRAALGYIRTYYYLIGHESDYILAQEKHLIPGSVSWTQFCAFTSNFSAIADGEVSDRYTFGELRLHRLNFYCKFILGKFRIHRLPTTYGAYFSRFYAPLLFVFAIFSVILNTLQVELAAESLTSQKWSNLYTISRVVSILTLTVSLGLLLWVFILLSFRFTFEWKYAILAEWKRSRKIKAISARYNISATA
jgi:hypothetical protein